MRKRRDSCREETSDAHALVPTSNSSLTNCFWVVDLSTSPTSLPLEELPLTQEMPSLSEEHLGCPIHPPCLKNTSKEQSSRELSQSYQPGSIT